MGSFLPGFGLLPLIVLACLPRRADWPFVYGAKDVIWPRDRPERVVLSPERALHRMRVARWIVTGLAASCLLAGDVGCWISLQPGAQPVGSALPVLTLQAATAPGAVLPEYARLVGVVVQRGSVWEHDHRGRQHQGVRSAAELISARTGKGDPRPDCPGPSASIGMGYPAPRSTVRLDLGRHRDVGDVACRRTVQARTAANFRPRRRCCMCGRSDGPWQSEKADIHTFTPTTSISASPV